MAKFSQGMTSRDNTLVMPSVKDPNLKVELVYKGIKFPTSMAFLGSNDFLVLEKNDGTVKRIVNGTPLPNPLLDVNVSTESERGLLGIAIAKHREITYVFLYFTESEGPGDSTGNVVLGNRLYRYELVNNTLIKPMLLLDLPAVPGPTHNGGKITIGPDNNIYLVIGIVGNTAASQTQTQNIRDGSQPDGRGGILRITQDGKIVCGPGILGDKIPLNLYYAYGIRNSFGIDFDPITGKLWDTENGPEYGDEINLVEPGFNSGWNKVQGIWKGAPKSYGNNTLIPNNLTDFGGRGKYSEPEFTWYNSVGPTGLAFYNYTQLGKQYESDMFVGDFHKGNVYRFELDRFRNEIYLTKPLEDKVSNNQTELQSVIFGQGFGGITDLKVGPDGNLYVLSLYNFPGGTNCDLLFGDPNKPCIQYSSSIEGSIFRISPKA